MRTSLVLTLTILAGCGNATTPASTAHPASVTPAPARSSAAATPPVKVDGVLPAASALSASLDLVKMAEPRLLKLLSGPKQTALETQLGLTHGQEGAELVAALGIDPSRPVTLAQLVLGDEGNKAIAALTPITPKSEPIAFGRPGAVQPTGLFEPVRQALATVPALASFRVLIPAKDATRVKGALGVLLDANELKPTETEGEYASRHALAAVVAAGDVVVLDFIAGDRAPDGLIALRAAAAKEHAAAPPLGEGAFAIRYVPARQAELGFLSGVMTTAAAVSGASIDPNQRERIMAEGLWEASQCFAFATDPRGARFTEVSLVARLDAGHPKLTVRAEPGPGYDGADGDLWSPTFGVTSGGPGTSFSLSRPFVDGWKLPGKDSATVLDAKAFTHAMNDVGWAGKVVALPEIPLVATRAIDASGLTPSNAVLEHFARFGVVPGPSAPVFLGVLPDGATKGAAECALAEKPPCGASKLTLAGVTPDGDGWARLAQVDGHYVVLRAGKKETLASAAFLTFARSLKGGPTGPVALDLDVGALFGPEGAGIAGRLVGTMRRDGKTVVTELAAP